VIASNHPETVLLIDANGRLLPVSTAAFEISRGAKRRITHSYVNSTIIFREGSVRKIKRIDFLGYWGATISRKLFSVANGGVRRINLELTDRPLSLAEIKSAVSNALPKDRQLREPFFAVADPLADVLRRIDEATSGGQIFDAIAVPPPDDALDILC
jgi:hypothetical protein